jgi:hypothetical protein
MKKHKYCKCKKFVGAWDGLDYWYCVKCRKPIEPVVNRNI